MLTAASARLADARLAGAEPLNGDGFYRFKIGESLSDRDLGRLWADTGPADPRHERL